MDCKKVSLQELLHCFDNGLEKNALNLEHKTENYN